MFAKFPYEPTKINILTFRLMCIYMDVYAHGMQVVLTLATAAGAAAAAIVYLAQNGNPNTNWLSICDQFGDFCQGVSGAVVASFFTVVVLMSLILLSAFALKKH